MLLLLLLFSFQHILFYRKIEEKSTINSLLIFSQSKNKLNPDSYLKLNEIITSQNNTINQLEDFLTSKTKMSEIASMLKNEKDKNDIINGKNEEIKQLMKDLENVKKQLALTNNDKNTETYVDNNKGVSLDARYSNGSSSSSNSKNSNNDENSERCSPFLLPPKQGLEKQCALKYGTKRGE